MRKILLSLLLSFVMTMSIATIAYSADYTVTQLTYNSYHDFFPQINNNGYVAWSGNITDSDGDIFLYDGSTTAQLINDYYDDYDPQINDNGYVVWKGAWPGFDTSAFIYDGSIIKKLPSHLWYYENDPQINNNGYVVWWGYDKPNNRVGEIFLYDGSTTIQLTDNSYDDRAPQINNNGYVVWHGHDGSDYEIFLYDGSITTQLTDNSYNDFSPQINNNGYVVWHGYDDSDSEIFLYDGFTITKLTDNSHPDYSSQINNNGYVVWEGRVGPIGDDKDIFLYDGSTITQLTDNSYDDYDPQINDNGYVVWHGGDYPFTEIFLYDGFTITQLTNNSYSDMNPKINDNGYVVWNGHDGNDYEIFLAIPLPWALNMTEMDWYENATPYSSTGAAVSQMILNYIREGAGEPLLTQHEIYEYARDPLAYDGTELTPDEVDKALGHFDPYDYLVSNSYDGYDSRPDGNPYQGYNYTVDTYDPALDPDAINQYMRDICHWMAYEVTQDVWWLGGALAARPNTPAAIPIYGSYDNWVAVKGFVASENPCPEPHADPWNTPDFTVYGFWMKDPQVTGIGQNTYKTAAECESTYFQPLATGDAYDGLFLQVAEPPAEMSDAAIEIPEPVMDLANLAFVGIETGEYEMAAASGESTYEPPLKKSWRDLVDPHLLIDSEAVAAFEGTHPQAPIFVHRLDNTAKDYYLIPYNKEIIETGYGQATGYGTYWQNTGYGISYSDLTSAVMILDASEGYFKEASWTTEPIDYSIISEEKAIELAKEDMWKAQEKFYKDLLTRYGIYYPSSTYQSIMSYFKSNFWRRYYYVDIQTHLAWAGGEYSPSPYKPFWEVAIGSEIWYVTQEGDVISK